MGNVLNKDNEVENNFKKKFKLIESLHDGHYGEITLMNDINTNQMVAVKEQLVANPDDVQRDIEQLRIKKDNPHPNLIKVIDYCIQTEDKLCSTFNRLIWVMEYFRKDLSVEIRSRRLHMIEFTEEEIKKILHSSISALSYLQKNHITHGDLKSSSVLFTDQFDVKIAEPTEKNQCNAFLQSMTGQIRKGTYLSPKLMDALNQKNWQPQHNIYKSDVFTLGMVIFESMIMKYCDEAFDFNQCRIKTDVIEKYLHIMSEKYSQGFLQIIEQMVIFDEDQRPDFISLEQMILQQQPKITESLKSNKQSFQEDFSTRVSFQQGEKENADNRISKQQVNRMYTPDRNVLGNIQTHSNNPIKIEDNYMNQSKQDIKLTQSFSQNNGNIVERKEEPLQCKQQAVLQEINPMQNYQEIKQHGVDLKAYSNNIPEPQYNLQSFTEQSNKVENDQQYYEIAEQKQNHRISQNAVTDQRNQSSYEYQISDEVQKIIDEYKNKRPKETETVKPKPVEQQNQQPNNQFVEQPIKTMCNFESFQNNNFENLQTQGSKYMIASEYYNNNKQTYDFKETVNNYEDYIKNPDKYNQQNSEVVQQTQSTPSYSDTQYNQVEVAKPVGQFESQFNQVDKQIPAMGQYEGQYNQIGAQKQVITQFDGQYTNQIESQKPALNQYEGQYTQLENQEPVRNQYETQYGKIDVQQPLHNQLEGSQYQLEASQHPVSQFERQYNQVELQKPVINQFDGQQYQLEKQQQGINQFENQYQDIDDQKQTMEQYENQQICNQFEHQQISASQFQNSMHHQPQDMSQYQNQQIQVPIYEDQQNGQAVQLESPENYNDYEKIQETYEDGSIYDGEKYQGLRNGHGKFFYADGGYYEGEWKFGRMEGLGTLYYPSGGLAYMGQWQDDKFNGQGTVYNEQPNAIEGDFNFPNFDDLGEYWVKYEGDFKNDNKEGDGTLYLSNNDRFLGQFSNDLVHGQGTYINAMGETLCTGTWENNHLIQ